MNQRSTLSPRGFTLVELLAVIAIIGLLVSLLLPALQSARETARVVQCRNNIRQLGQAVLGHEAAFKTFPPATQWVPGTSDGLPDVPWARQNWLALILPRLEQQATADLLVPAKSMAADENRPFRSTRMPLMLCPTDPFNQTVFNGSRFGMGDGWERTNYGANASLLHMTPAHACGASSPGWTSSTYRGMMGCGTAVLPGRVRDGLSSTVLLCEMRAGLRDFDPRGTWAMADSSSSIWANGSHNFNESGGDCNGPNPAVQARLDSDDLPTQICSQVVILPEGRNELMLCSGGGGTSSIQSATRSKHRGGAHVCFADGTVHFISDFIDTTGWLGNPAGPQFSVWDRLMLSADGQPVASGSY